MGQHAESEVAKDVYLVIYFVAIATALIRHHTQISQHNDQDLQRFFETYQETPWMLPELKQLFAKATDMTA
ncbi:hypothetical protein ACFL3F_02060 [Planctomycetota bacterium]